METVLRHAGLRVTNQRKLILSILHGASMPMTAEEIHKTAAQHDTIGLSTTYRILSLLTQHGLLLKNEGSNGFSYYQMASLHEHQHTMHCTGCGFVVPIEDCPLGELEQKLSAKTGFDITGHSLTFSGLCPKCLKKQKNDDEI